MLTKAQIVGIKQEVKLTTTRSSGPGGQHVNKVETKVTARWQPSSTEYLSDPQRSSVIKRLATKLSKDGFLVISADAHRSQLKNKELAFRKLITLINQCLKTPKPRKPSKPSKAATEKRIKKKKKQSDKKRWRQKLM